MTTGSRQGGLVTRPVAAGPVGGGRLLIVGGGLSAAQLASQALRLGWGRVTLLCRGALTVRSFDITEEWMGRHLSADLEACELDFFASGAAARRESASAA